MPKESSEAVPTDHWRNFLDCLKTREKPRADLASVAQTTITCHMVNVALESQEVIRWDAKANDLAGSNGRGTLAYARPYRAPHVLPMNG